MLKQIELRPWLRFITVVGFLIATWSCCPAQDGLFSVGDLDRMSNLIVVGTLTGGVDHQLSISIDRVIKGSAESEPNIKVVWVPGNGGDCETTPPTSPSHAIWFLQKASDGTIEFVPGMFTQRCYPGNPDYAIPAGPISGSLSYQSSDPVTYKLAVELASTLMNSTTVPRALQRYSGIFSGLDSKHSDIIGQLLENSPTEPVKRIGHLRRIIAASPAGLDLLASDALTIMQSRSNSTASASAIQTRDKLQLTEAISQINNTSARTITVLAEIASNPNQDLQVRIAASRALRNIHTASAVVAMAPLIDDPDSLISMYALSALACYANAIPVMDDTIPGHNINLNNDGPLKTKETLANFVMGPMESNAQAIKTYWKQWWQAHQASVLQAAGS
jgi:hypothetical protein